MNRNSVATYHDAEEAAILRALEELSVDTPVDLSRYLDPMDAHWLGIGMGICRERGWVSSSRPGVYDISEAGRDELQLRRNLRAPRVKLEHMPSENWPRSTNFRRVLNG